MAKSTGGWIIPGYTCSITRLENITFYTWILDHNNGSYNLHSVLSLKRFEGKSLLLDPKRKKNSLKERSSDGKGWNLYTY